MNNYALMTEEFVKRKKRIKVRDVVDATWTYAVLLAVCAIFLFPVLWIVMASFSKSGSLGSFDGFFPKEYSFDSFIKLFTDTAWYDYPKWFFNTFVIAAVSCAFSTILVVLTAYVMSRFRFKARKSIMKITLILGMFPSFMGMTAIFILMIQFNMVNSHLGLIFIYSASAPMGYLVQKGFFDTIPNTIYDAARIDGANNLKVFIKITLPLSLPIIVYTALTSFAWPWSDYILPALLLKDKPMYTVAVGLMSLPEAEFSRFAAGAVFIAVPIIILFVCLVKYLVNGLTAGAVKE